MTRQSSASKVKSASKLSTIVAFGKAFAALLDGVPSAYRDAVLLNSAAALHIAGKAGSLSEGVERAVVAIDSGAAKSKVTALAALTSAA